MRNCKNTKDVCPISKFCPPCSAWMKDYSKRSDSQERQQQARDQVHAQNRGMFTPSPDPPIPTMSYIMPQVSSTQAGSGGTAPTTQPPSSRPPSNNSSNYPPMGAGAPTATPPIDITSLTSSYNQMKATNTQPPILMDMFALLLNVHSKQSENDEIRSEVQQNTSRLDSIETKIGGPDDVSERLGLALRRLPLPPPGQADLDMVRQALAEINAPGIDVKTDITKAVRKLPTNPGPNTPQPILGTVLVEVKSEEIRAKIMKNKHTLASHPNEVIKNLIVKNMKTKEQMFMENLGNSILRKIPGCESSFVTPSGQIREGTQTPYQPRNGHPQHQQNQRPQNPAHHNPRPQNPATFQPSPAEQAARRREQNPPPQHAQLHQYLPARQAPQQQPQFNFYPPQGFQTFPPNPFFGPSMFNTPAPQPVTPAVSQPTTQVPTQDPYQSLLLQLDPLNTMRSSLPPPAAAPTLHLLQPAAPHYDQTQTEQEQHSNSNDE